MDLSHYLNLYHYLYILTDKHELSVLFFCFDYSYNANKSKNVATMLHFFASFGSQFAFPVAIAEINYQPNTEPHQENKPIGNAQFGH